MFVKIELKQKTICKKCSKIEDIDWVNFNDSNVFVEKYVTGKNITVTVYIDENKVLIFPMVFDYPFLKENNYYLKTGGIKCEYVSEFTDDKDVLYKVNETVVKICKTLSGKYERFLSIQLLVSSDNVFIVEFDIRPGEPEFINVVQAVDDDVELCEILLKKKGVYYVPAKKFNSLSICVAEKNYPYKRDIRIKIDELLKDKNNNFKVYFSKAYVDNGMICNYDGGRLLFAYFEQGKNNNIEQLIDKFEETYSNIIHNSILRFFR